VFQSVKRQREYLGYRSGTPELAGPESSLPILIGAAMIAAASPSGRSGEMMARPVGLRPSC
jgi:hypothetical protein